MAVAGPMAARVAMSPGSEVYLAAGAPSLGQWSGAPRLAAPTPVWTPQAAAAPRPVVVAGFSSHPQPIAPAARAAPGAPGVPGAPAAFPLSRQRKEESPKGLTVPSGLASTADEGFFRKRRGEGKSSGGGPSSITLSQSGNASSSMPSFATLSRDVSREPTPGTLGSAPSATSGVRLAPRAHAVANDSQTSQPSSPQLLPRQEPSAPSSRPAARGAPSSSKQSPSQAEATRAGAATTSRTLGRHPLGQQREERAPSAVPRRRGASEDPSERSRMAEGLGAKGGRRGEGRSSGGGPSQISLGESKRDETSRSPVSERGRLACSMRRAQSEAPATAPLLIGHLSGSESPPATRRGGGEAVAASQPAPREPAGSACPSYDELLTENRQLREELAQARYELAAYQRWYGGGV